MYTSCMQQPLHEWRWGLFPPFLSHFPSRPFTHSNSNMHTGIHFHITIVEKFKVFFSWLSTCHTHAWMESTWRRFCKLLINACTDSVINFTCVMKEGAVLSVERNACSTGITLVSTMNECRLQWDILLQVVMNLYSHNLRKPSIICKWSGCLIFNRTSVGMYV